MKKVLFAGLFLAFSLINSSNAYGVTARPGATQENPIVLKIGGEPSQIELPSNHSTGFEWYGKCTPMNKVAITKDYKKKPSFARQGSGGFDVFSVEPAEAAEEVVCTFEYKRLGEDKAPVESRKYFFSITE